ncbi:MAG: response regulator transcription factor [Betaproteobacteria bacterium]|nr:response regulator transcription factor [Betaproteobacteria bacterium]
MKLLIVDNSMPVRKRLSDMFESVPAIEVIQAAELAEGFAQLRQFTPHAMILDLKFPDGNGFDLLGYTKQNFPSVIVMVNTNAIYFRKQCLALGADFFFDKSLETNDLVDTIISYRDRLLSSGQP